MCAVVTTEVLGFPEVTGKRSISFGLLLHSLEYHISTTCKLTIGTSSTGPVTVVSSVNILDGFRRHVVLPDNISVNKCL